MAVLVVVDHRTRQFVLQIACLSFPNRLLSDLVTLFIKLAVVALCQLPVVDIERVESGSRILHLGQVKSFGLALDRANYGVALASQLNICFELLSSDSGEELTRSRYLISPALESLTIVEAGLLVGLIKQFDHQFAFRAIGLELVPVVNERTDSYGLQASHLRLNKLIVVSELE